MNKKIIGVSIFILLIGVIVGIKYFSGNKDVLNSNLTTIYVATGGGKEDFISDKEVSKLLAKKYKIQVVYDNWSNGKTITKPLIRESVNLGNNDVITKIKNGEKIDDLWIDVYNWYSQNEYWKNKLKEDLKGLEYSNKAENIKKENIEKLYGNTLKASISKLEQYRKCPFSFHLTYGLKLKEDKQYEISAIDTGSFMHDIIDAFFDRIENLEIEDEEIEKIVEEIIKLKNE